MSVVVGQRNVPDTPQNRMFYAVDEARGLACHTIKITANRNIFLPEYERITNEVVTVALQIYTDAWEANNVRVVTADDWKTRRELERSAYRKCYRLLAMSDLAKQLFHLKHKKVKYWQQLTIKTRNLLQKWYESDCQRYADTK